MRAMFLVLPALVLAGLPLAGADHVSSLDEVPWGCPRRDCIPSIDAPVFGDGAWLADDDRVLGIEVGGASRAYPVRILNWHEIVNDDVGGVPVVVTYCPLCGTGLTFERGISAGTTTFGVSGRLFHNDLVMYDRATESYWSQVLGEAIWGDLHGERLRFVPTATTTWGEWRASHPGTQVLERPSTYPSWRYDQYPYGNYENDDSTLFPVENPSNALHPKAWVLGVFTDNETIAFRKDDVESRGIIREPFDGRTLLVMWQEGTPRATWADDGTTPHQVLVFWFAWHDIHPETRLWGRLLAQVVLPREEGGVTRIVFSEAVDAPKLGVHFPEGVVSRWASDRVLELEGAKPFTIPAGAYGVNGTSLEEPLDVPLGTLARDPPRAVGRGIPAVPVALVGAAVALAALVSTFRRR